MVKLVRTRKNVTFSSNCLFDDMYKSAISYLSKYDSKTFKSKNEIYNLLDEHMRNSGICNPEVHLGKGNQTSKTLLNKSIQNGFIQLKKEE